MSTRERPRPARGRPPVPEKHEQILDACFDLLSDVGYARMSIDAVARRAGVTRPTVYRRWPSKEALAVAALERAQSGIDQLPETEDAAADLVVHLRSLHQTLSRPNGMAIIGTMLAEEHTTPALLDGFRRHVVSPRRAPLRRLIGRAAPLADDDTQDLLVDLLVGAFYARYVAGTPFPTDWAERTVRAVLTGHRPAATTDPTRRP